MRTLIVAHDGVVPVKKDDMVIIIPKEEVEQRLDHLNRLIPTDQVQYDEITELFNLVEGKPTFKLIIGGKS